MAQDNTDEHDLNIIYDPCSICGAEIEGREHYREHLLEHAENCEIPGETAVETRDVMESEDEGVDMIKFTSGFCLIVGGLLCMTLVGGVIGLPMVAFGYYLYKKYDIEFEVKQ